MQKLDEMKICKEETDIQELFEFLRESAMMICKDKKLVFTKKSNCKTAVTDGAVLEQIITNLISNTVRYAKTKCHLTADVLTGTCL